MNRDPRTNQLRILAWEVTRSCNLNCRHCRAAAQSTPPEGELTTVECESVLRNISSFSKPVIILTGGEPMLRPDIYHLARFGTDLGLRMVMAPCGMLLDHSSCANLLSSGIQRISLSIDGATAETHDSFRRVTGAFEGVMRGIEVARATGLPFQINTTVTRLNLEELPAIFDMAARLGAVSFHPFLLVPAGRGKEIAGYEISPQDYERVLNWIYENRNRYPMTLKPTCAPHYYRIMRQREQEAGRVVLPQTHGLDAMTRGCLGGQSFAFISSVGRVQMCGFLEHEAGNLKSNRFNFKEIWEDSPFFKQIRTPQSYKGRCGFCEYRNVCGGCRARAFAMSGDCMSEEPFCIYEPKTPSSKTERLQ